MDRQTGREYACKVLPKVRGRLTPAKTARKIWQEVELLTRVQTCANVARLQTVFEDDARVYIVLELCQGGDLETLLDVRRCCLLHCLALFRQSYSRLFCSNAVLRCSLCQHQLCVPRPLFAALCTLRLPAPTPWEAGCPHPRLTARFPLPAQDHGPMSERQTALVIYECLKVIAACHAEGLVHGDVKPANFLLKQRMRNPLALIESGAVRGWLRAIDFGCSQEMRGSQLSRRTGTPGASFWLVLQPSNTLVCLHANQCLHATLPQPFAASTGGRCICMSVGLLI